MWKEISGTLGLVSIPAIAALALLAVPVAPPFELADNAAISLAKHDLNAAGGTVAMTSAVGERAATLHAQRRSVDVESSGRALYMQRCASCHGSLARGTDSGPSLLNVPSESASTAGTSRLAATWTHDGASHAEGLSRDDLGDLIRFIRLLRSQQRL